MLVYHRSWIGLALELMVVVALRSVFSAAAIACAWPANTPRDPWSALVRRCVLFTIGAGFVLLPWAGLMFALAVVSLSWLFLVALPVVILLAVFLHGGAITRGWWVTMLPRRSALFVLLAFGVCTAFGALISWMPAALGVPLSVGAGLVNAWLWTRAVDTVVTRAAGARRVPVAPIGLVAVVLVLVVSLVGAFQVAQTRRGNPYTPGPASPPDWHPDRRAAEAPLVVVTGFNTRWNGHPSDFVHLDYAQWRFSYRGMDARGRPVAYRREDTHRSIRDLALELGRQVDTYAARAGRKVTIVAESEGSLIAKAYLAGTPSAPVRALVLLSPLLDPGGVYYPPEGQEGWGVLGAAQMGVLSWALGGVSPVQVAPDTPFLRSLVDAAPLLAATATCHLRGLREAALVPLDTALGSPASARARIPYHVVLGLHGGMLDDPETARLVAAVTHDRRLPGPGAWSIVERVVQHAAAVWRAPPLARSVNRAWDHQPRSS